MTPERAFILWFANKQFMVVKKHRPEVRAHIGKALAIAAATGTAKTPKAVECEASQSGPKGIAQ